MSPSESTNLPPDQPAEGEAERGDADPWGTGLRKAAAHFIKAGYEMLAGVNALLEEIIPSDGGGGSSDDGPERIEVE